MQLFANKCDQCICSFQYLRKDDICFRRKKVRSVASNDATTQSKISCKPLLLYELKCVENDPIEKLTERNNQRHEENHKNHTTNPFQMKPKENHEIKTNNHLRNLDKNSSHRHQTSRHQDDHSIQVDDRSLRSKHNNHRPKENNERREQNDIERTKRRRSPSTSKDHKRMRRSRSRSRDRSKRDRERNANERNSPDKVSRSLVCIFMNLMPNDVPSIVLFAQMSLKYFIIFRINSQKPKDKSNSVNSTNGNKEPHKRRSSRSPQKHDLRYRLRNKREKSDKHSHHQVTEDRVEPNQMSPKEKITCDETVEVTTQQIPEPVEIEEVAEVEIEEVMIVDDVLPSNKIALEEGEIDDSSNDIVEDNTKSILYEPIKSEELPVHADKSEVNGHSEDDAQKFEEKIPDVPKLIAVSMIPTAEVHIACEASIAPTQNDDQLQKEQQQQLQQCQLSNGIAHNTVEESQNEEKLLNGMPLEDEKLKMETQTFDRDTVSKVKIPFNYESEIAETVASENHQETIPEIKSNPIDTKPLMDENVPEFKLENDAHQDESIPHMHDNNSNNLSESHNTIEPINDSSNSMHNTSGSKSVNISTSKRDYLIVEDENNEQTIYVTRKKKKKKKKKISVESV